MKRKDRRKPKKGNNVKDTNGSDGEHGRKWKFSLN